MPARRLALTLALTSALVFGPVVSATAVVVAPAAPATAGVAMAKVKSFANCTAVGKVYPGGIAKSGVRYNQVSGKNRAFKVKPKVSTALYNANRKLDRDRDGVACEK